MMLRNKAAIIERFGKYIDVNKYWESAKRLGEDEKAWLESHQTITYEQYLKEKPWQSTL